MLDEAVAPEAHNALGVDEVDVAHQRIVHAQRLLVTLHTMVIATSSPARAPRATQ